MEQTDQRSLSMFRKAFCAARRRAIKKDVPFDISVQDIITQHRTQHGRCHYSGIEMNIVKDSASLHDPYKMTIDCKDQDLGYVGSNIVLCIYCVNSLKQKMPYAEMLLICRKIVMNHDAKN